MNVIPDSSIWCASLAVFFFGSGSPGVEVIFVGAFVACSLSFFNERRGFGNNFSVLIRSKMKEAG